MAKMKNILFKNGKNALLAGLDYLEVKEKSGILMRSLYVMTCH